MQELINFHLGESKEHKNIDSRDENFQSSLRMARQAGRFLDIISRELDPFIYDQKEFVTAVKQLVIGNRHAKVRILLAEPEKIMHRGHRLIDLAFDLSSYIELRKHSQENKDFNEGILIADRVGYIHRKNDARYEAKFNFNDMRFSSELLSKFDELWETAKPDPNLRRVTI